MGNVFFLLKTMDLLKRNCFKLSFPIYFVLSNKIYNMITLKCSHVVYFI